MEVSMMGMGCWAIGGPSLNIDGSVLGYGNIKDEDSIKAIQKGIDLGITLFETSDTYGCGRSERVLGEALQDYRDDVVIAAKFSWEWDFNSQNPNIPCRLVKELELTPQNIFNSLMRSMERLQTEYIDLFQLRLPTLEFEKIPEVVEMLEQLEEEGYIINYGWSTPNPDLAKVFATGKYCTAIQFRHNIFSHNNAMIEEVLKPHNLAGLIQGPLGYGFLTGKYLSNTDLPKEHMLKNIDFNKGRPSEILSILKELIPILTSEGRSVTQGALGWIWAQNELLIPIPGFKNIEQVEENASAMDFGPLKKDQLDEIDEILKKIETPSTWLDEYQKGF